MTKLLQQDHASCDLYNDDTWQEWLPILQTRAEYWTGSFRVSTWLGQERFIADDAVQEAALRILERDQRVIRGEAGAMQHPERMIIVTELNYLRDERRHDLRMARWGTDESLFEGQVVQLQYIIDPAEVAVENVFRESIFFWVAHEIARFPDKERTALLYDLAVRMSFDDEPTPLQSAFLEEGIDLRDYVDTLSDDKKERARHAALLWHAYKRLKELALNHCPEYESAA